MAIFTFFPRAAQALELKAPTRSVPHDQLRSCDPTAGTDWAKATAGIDNNEVTKVAANKFLIICTLPE
jgi:hypothetical protein